MICVFTANNVIRILLGQVIVQQKLRFEVLRTNKCPFLEVTAIYLKTRMDIESDDLAEETHKIGYAQII